MKKNEFISVRIEKDLKDKLEKIAEKEERSISNVVYRIIRDYIKNNEEPTPRSKCP